MKSKNILLLLALVISFFVLNGCATLIKGTTEEVRITSCPDNAKISVNGANLGKTPFKTQLKSNQTYTIEFEKEGYENRTVLLNNSVMAGYVVLDILCGLAPVIVDAATASWFTLDNNDINVILEKQKE
jgi:hypothetical protein